MATAPNNVIYRRIAADLRAEMLSGKLPPDARMPTREQVVRRYRTTKVTVQKAFDLLADQGWVRAEGRRGTFVKEQGARREEYALAFPWPQAWDVSQFYRALRQQAEQLSTPQRRLTCFYEISGHVDTEDYQRLAGLVRSHRIAGLIFASNVFIAEGFLVLEEPGVPRVAISWKDPRVPVPCVSTDVETFYEKAFAELAAAGRRRVAVIARADEWNTLFVLERLPDLAAARGLTIERRWMQAAPTDVPQWARQAAELLLQSGTPHRPDALLITDDNLVPEATAGVRAAGVRVPDDVLVIAHTNFPHPTPAAVPVTRIGFDISQLLALCVERIDQQRRGETPAAATLLPAVFAEDLTTAPGQETAESSACKAGRMEPAHNKPSQ